MSATTTDEAEAAAEGAEGAPKKSKKKLIILIAAPLLLLIVAGAGLWFSGILGGKGEKADEHGAAAHGEKDAHGEKGEKGKDGKAAAVFFDMPDLLVNITGNGKKPSFLKMSVALEIETATDLPRVQAVLPRIIDNFQVYLRELRLEDLKGSAGLYRMREELLLRVNAAAAPAKVSDVLFKEMLVQ